MASVALGKPINEEISQPSEATDGKVTGYTAVSGYAKFQWPGTLTVDLQDLYPLKCIRILLWDNLVRAKVNQTQDGTNTGFSCLTTVGYGASFSTLSIKDTTAGKSSISARRRLCVGFEFTGYGTQQTKCSM
jgi:hypothetical protein